MSFRPRLSRAGTAEQMPPQRAGYYRVRMRILKRKFPRSSPESRDSFHDFPLLDADACVKCGLCLPHCPTYALHQHEGDSPRGRIALMQGLAQGELDPRGSAVQHLDGCLVCRACEPVCPAEVPYGRLIDAGRRGLWRSGHRPGMTWRLLAFLRRTPRRLAWLARLLRFTHYSGLARIFASLPLGRAARAARFIRGTGTPPAPGLHSPIGDAHGNVALFLGCLARALDADVLHATVRVLNAMQFRVHIPAAQGCCGAMDAHAGDADTARSHAERNLAAFEATMPIVSTASGCGVQLKEYGETVPDGGEAFSARTADIMTFIAAHAARLPAMQSRGERVVVHSPCTLKNGMREDNALAMLRNIPGLNVEPLRHRDCCGAAGSYLFEHP